MRGTLAGGELWALFSDSRSVGEPVFNDHRGAGAGTTLDDSADRAHHAAIAVEHIPNRCANRVALLGPELVELHAEADPGSRRGWRRTGDTRK